MFRRNQIELLSMRLLVTSVDVCFVTFDNERVITGSSRVVQVTSPLSLGKNCVLSSCLLWINYKGQLKVGLGNMKNLTSYKCCLYSCLYLYRELKGFYAKMLNRMFRKKIEKSKIGEYVNNNRVWVDQGWPLN